MTVIAITGAGGFLGFHVRAAAQEHGVKTVRIPVGQQFDLLHARAALNGADTVIHLAGVNRGTGKSVTTGNALFAQQLAASLRGLEQAPRKIVYANSIHAGKATEYGQAKQQAADVLATLAQELGIEFVDVILPDIFGEYGRPFYNSIVATFSHVVAHGEQPEIQQDRQLQLLHAQNAADILLGRAQTKSLDDLSHWETVGGVKRLLQEFQWVYAQGEFPDLATTFRRDLFNTYRSYTFPDHTPLVLNHHTDYRGAFSEIVRSHGGPGQAAFFTTAPGTTRGNNYHRRKIERFTVLSGTADIKLRRLFDDKIFSYRITGEAPRSVDMPTMYAHSISNVGDEMLLTALWTNDHFDPERTDTIAELVTCASSAQS